MNTGNQFLQLMREAPAEKALAALCSLYELSNRAEVSPESKNSLLSSLRDHTRGELKRAIRSLREAQTQARQQGDKDSAECAEQTIAFIRRELLQRA